MPERYEGLTIHPWPFTPHFLESESFILPLSIEVGITVTSRQRGQSIQAQNSDFFYLKQNIPVNGRIDYNRETINNNMNRSFRNLSSNHSSTHNDRSMNYSAGTFEHGDIDFFDDFEEPLWERSRIPPAALLHDIRIHETGKSRASKSRKQREGTHIPKVSSKVLPSPRSITRKADPVITNPLVAERRSSHSISNTPKFSHDGTSDLHQTNSCTAPSLVSRGSRRYSFCDASDYTSTTQSSTTVSTSQASSRKSRASSPRGRRKNSVVARTLLNADEQKHLFNCDQVVVDKQPLEQLEYSLNDLFEEEVTAEPLKKVPSHSSGKIKTKQRTSSRTASAPALELSATNEFVQNFQVWQDESPTQEDCLSSRKANSGTDSTEAPSSFQEMFQCETGRGTPQTPANIKRVLVSKQTHIKALQEIDHKKRRAMQRTSSGRSSSGSQPRLARKSSSSSSGTKMRRSSSSRHEARPSLSVRRKSSSKSSGRKKKLLVPASQFHHQKQHALEDTPKARRVRRASMIQNAIPIDSFLTNKNNNEMFRLLVRMTIKPTNLTLSRAVAINPFRTWFGLGSQDSSLPIISVDIAKIPHSLKKATHRIIWSQLG